MREAQVSVADRMRQTHRLLRVEGVKGVTTRLRRRAASALAPPGTESLSVSREDLRRAAALMASATAFS